MRMRRRRSLTPLSAKDIAGEALHLAGGGRALLLQIAHPAIGRGVVEHSDFANRIEQRLHATMTFMYASVYATPEEVQFVRRSVNRAHAPVRSDAREGTPGYNAFDPELQLWVAATLYQTTLMLFERVFGAVPAVDGERLYREFCAQLSVLQLRPESWPPTREDFDRYWSESLHRLSSTEETRAVARQILYPDAVPFWMRALLPLARLVTVGLLPEVVRDHFELAWNERLQSRFDRWMALTAVVYPLIPRRIRYRPRDFYLGRLRRMVRESGREPSFPPRRSSPRSRPRPGPGPRPNARPD